MNPGELSSELSGVEARPLSCAQVLQQVFLVAVASAPNDEEGFQKNWNAA
eukprot:CAMPEP_0181318624 /NCGR_PEP_ID=MMETSP1101-20121128/17108_1 /TAXON_ID=46948 /ORGANISM="Rhodomonas abbreviata, Strain Caron Lab Isolate" /LENGTH=49 /DNA_ID=CAMNT_0023426111 /DNA_START=544 /DNA_END=694 /DNA_ORIENTATION=+